MPNKNLPIHRLFKKELSALIAGGRPKIENTARHFGMPVRTMQRRLQEAGLTYSELLDEVRYDAACRKLKTCRMSVSAIAKELGFTDASNFSRAFQRWSGMPPSKYRDKYKTN
jgi:AraC-like DNA-binding protein